MKRIAIALCAALALSACGSKEEPVSFATLEDARAQARANGEYNAQLYRAENPRFTDHKIVSHGDSTQSPDCPQGDGWASNTLMSVNGKQIEKFKDGAALTMQVRSSITMTAPDPSMEPALEMES